MPCAFRLNEPLRFRPSCLFPVPEDELVEFDGQTWCRYHLPLKADNVTSSKAHWTPEQIAAFNEEIFDCIDEAKKGNRVADLSGVVFPGEISFRRYKGETGSLPAMDFSQASFGGDAQFNGVRFGSYALFTGASFSSKVRFATASFGGNARFVGASFGGDARFDRACFDGLIDFSSSGESAQSSAATFHRISFAGATFGGPARFHNRKFLSTTNFRGVVFERAPEFHGCTLHQDTIFPPQRNFRDRSGADAARAYRTLKHAMASVHARGEEAKFYALEQKSLRASPDIGRWEWLFSWLYEKTADYGQSFVRPLAWLLASTFIVFPLLYALALVSYLYLWPEFVYPAIHFEDLLRFSLQQVFQPFGVFRVQAAAEAVCKVQRVLPWWPRAILATIQSLLTFSFLALFLLALRRRFKLD